MEVKYETREQREQIIKDKELEGYVLVHEKILSDVGNSLIFKHHTGLKPVNPEPTFEELQLEQNVDFDYRLSLLEMGLI